MKGTIRVCLCCILNFAIVRDLPAQEQDGASDETAMLGRENVAGFIVDNTMTFIGRQFYDDFATAWLDQGVADSKNISIHEQPTALSGTRIWVEYNQQILFQAFISPVRSDIDNTARRAAATVAQRFKTMELERTLFNDPDLGKDEF